MVKIASTFSYQVHMCIYNIYLQYVCIDCIGTHSIYIYYIYTDAYYICIESPPAVFFNAVVNLLSNYRQSFGMP